MARAAVVPRTQSIHAAASQGDVERQKTNTASAARVTCARSAAARPPRRCLASPSRTSSSRRSGSYLHLILQEEGGGQVLLGVSRMWHGSLGHRMRGGGFLRTERRKGTARKARSECRTLRAVESAAVRRP